MFFPPSGFASGDVLAGRYGLTSMLGRGAQGEVWSAEDAATRERVAVKLLSARGVDAPRVRREVTAMRWLAVPGAVRLRDEGVERGCPFLVMDLVAGEPFPAVGKPCAWGDLGPIATAILETLVQVHAAGIVHRDLKPSNVLVTAERVPVVLDFGLSRFVSGRADDLTAEGEMLGTPAYVAPEQIRGEAVTARTDLYALGGMLYEALSGRLPHDAPDWMTMLRARLTRRPAPLEEVAPGVPASVARTIDAMLALAPEERPASATEVLSRMAGHVPAGEPALPWMGSREDVEHAVRELGEGRSLDLAAAPGAGRTRFVEEVARGLSERGFEIHCPVPGSAPFVSLASILGIESGAGDRSLEEVVAQAAEEMRAALSAGAVLLVDDVAGLDACSALVVERARLAGPVLRLRSGAEDAGMRRLRPVTETDLRGLFAGPDRLFHLREDAASVLFERTGGLWRRVAEELGAWVRAGVARREGATFHVGEEEIERLREGLSSAPRAAPDRVEEATLPRWVAEIGAWAAIGGDPASSVQVARASQIPRFRVEAGFLELSSRALSHGGARGAARGEKGESMSLGGAVIAGNVWPEERVRQAHRRFAEVLSPGSRRRMLHLLACGDAGPGELAEEALCAAGVRASQGRYRAAAGLVEEAARFLRVDGGAAGSAEGRRLEEWVFAAWLSVAMRDGTPGMLDRLLYAVDRSAAPGPGVQKVAGLARAALAQALEPARAMRLAEEVGEMPDPALERLRRELRMSAARAGTVETEERVFAETERWAASAREAVSAVDAAAGEVVEGWLSSLRGRLLYRQGRFDEAAAAHQRAAALAPGKPERVLQRVHAAAAWLEAFRHEEAKRAAEEALSELGSLRDPVLEARAEWAFRAASYRLGETAGADLELVAAVEALKLPYFAPLVALTEAAAAFRAGDLGTGRALAERAAAGWESARIQPEPVLLARALAIACGAPVEEGSLRGLVERAVSCRVLGIGAQILGLVARAWPEEVSVERQVWRALVADVPEDRRGRRMDVLSVEEAERAIVRWTRAPSDGGEERPSPG